MKTQKKISLAATLLAAIAMSTAAVANPVAPKDLYEAMQDGQDAVITLWNDPEVYPSWTRTLVRENIDTNRFQVVFEDKTFSGDDWLCGIETCAAPDVAYCQENPDDCVDCDGDEIPECSEVNLSFECEDHGCLATFRDECVPPGQMRYHLLQVEDDECQEWDQLDMAIADAGQDCPDGDLDEYECAGQADSDTDPDDRPDDEEDTDPETDSGDDRAAGGGGGCAAVGAGSGPSPGWIWKLLLP